MSDTTGPLTQAAGQARADTAAPRPGAGWGQHWARHLNGAAAHRLQVLGDGEVLATGAAGGGTQPWPQWCQQHPGSVAQLLLQAPQLHDVLVPVEHARDDTAALAWAQAQWLHFHGDHARTWPLAVWQLGRRRGVSAWPGGPALLASWCAVAEAHRVRLMHIGPHWLQRCQAALRQEPALRRGPARLLLPEAGMLGVLDWQDGELQTLQWRRWQGGAPSTGAGSGARAAPSTPLDPPRWAPWLASAGPTFCCDEAAPSAAPRRLRQPLAPRQEAAGSSDALETAAPSPGRHRWTRWAQPGPTLHGANFLQPTRGVHRLAWWLAGAALAALATAAVEAQQAWQTLQQAQADATLRLPHRDRTDPVAVGTPRTLPPSAASQGVAAASGPDRPPSGALQRPWGTAFAALDAATVPGVVWLSMQTTDSGQWRWQGQAPDTATALAAAQALRTRPEWTQVVAVRIERQAEAGVRFEISAKWRGAW